MTSIKVITSDSEQVIDNVMSVEQAMGDVDRLYYFCGSYPMRIQCPECKTIGPSEFCGKRKSIVIRSGLGELQIETPDRTHIFDGNNTRWERT